jgi:signal transduction histidine kinase
VGRRVASVAMINAARRYWPRRTLLVDAGIALAALAVTLGLGQGGSPSRHDLDALGVVLALAASLPVVAARGAPGAVFAITGLASAAFVARGYGDSAAGPLVALYFLGARSDRPHDALLRGTIALIFVLHVAAALHAAGSGYSVVPPPFVALLWFAAWMIGERVQERRERLAERARRLAVAEERARIARDLHDSAGHAINVILVQAGAARLLHDRDPEASRSAIATIEVVARETLSEIDHLVRALREDSEGSEVESPAGLAALAALAERHRASGTSVSVEVHGTTRPLPRRVDLAAFRILQEALTNVARHGTGNAAVEITYAAEALQVTVTNRSGDGATAAGGGHGLVGMRERAALLGGSLDAASAGGTFTVKARLPYAGGA